MKKDLVRNIVCAISVPIKQKLIVRKGCCTIDSLYHQMVFKSLKIESGLNLIQWSYCMSPHGEPLYGILIVFFAEVNIADILTVSKHEKVIGFS